MGEERDSLPVPWSIDPRARPPSLDAATYALLERCRANPILVPEDDSLPAWSRFQGTVELLRTAMRAGWVDAWFARGTARADRRRMCGHVVVRQISETGLAQMVRYECWQQEGGARKE